MMSCQSTQGWLGSARRRCSKVFIDDNTNGMGPNVLAILYPITAVHYDRACVIARFDQNISDRRVFLAEELPNKACAVYGMPDACCDIGTSWHVLAEMFPEWSGSLARNLQILILVSQYCHIVRWQME